MGGSDPSTVYIRPQRTQKGDIPPSPSSRQPTRTHKPGYEFVVIWWLFR